MTIGMVMTGGFLWLVLYWIPRKKLQLTHEIVTLAEADSILVQVGQIFSLVLIITLFENLNSSPGVALWLWPSI